MVRCSCYSENHRIVTLVSAGKRTADFGIKGKADDGGPFVFRYLCAAATISKMAINSKLF